MLIIVSLLCKLSATIRTAFESPIHSFRSIPTNWFRVVFCVDTHHPPELLPGLEQIKHEFRFGKWIYDYIFNLLNKNKEKAAMESLLFVFLTPFLFLPALAYRWSLKSSSIIWLPLIWVIGWKRENDADANGKLQSELKWMCRSAWSMIVMLYSLAVIFLLTLLPLVLKEQFTHLKETINPNAINPMLGKLMDYFIATRIEPWHVSRFFAAVLSLVLFFYAERLLIQREHKPNAGLGSVQPLFRAIKLVRVPLSLFTIACGVWLLASTIDWAGVWGSIEWVPNGWGWGK